MSVAVLASGVDPVESAPVEPELQAIRDAVIAIRDSFRDRDQAVVAARDAGHSWPAIVRAATLHFGEDPPPPEPGELRSPTGAKKVYLRTSHE